MKSEKNTPKRFLDGRAKYNVYFLLSALALSTMSFLAVKDPSVKDRDQQAMVVKRIRETSRQVQDTGMKVLVTSLDRDAAHVYLTWVVRGQSAGGFYVIERFVPGHYEDARYIHFIPSGKVNASNEILYSFIDKDPLPENSAYRVWYFGDNCSFVKGEVFMASESDMEPVSCMAGN